MDKNRVIETTNELYKLTLLFPKKEPLRFKMRELADEILANFVTYFNPVSNPLISPGLVENSYNLFEVLDSFFEVAKEQNWVKPIDILNLQQEYKNIKHGLKEPKEQPSFAKAAEGQKEKEEIIETESSPVQLAQGLSSIPLPDPLVAPESSAMEESNVEVSDRQKIILDMLKQKEGVQVWEVKDILPDVSKRTLRRDFRKLLKDGLVERRGERNTTFYQIKKDGTP